jgi:hypothetical protein
MIEWLLKLAGNNETLAAGLLALGGIALGIVGSALIQWIDRYAAVVMNGTSYDVR